MDKVTIFNCPICHHYDFTSKMKPFIPLTPQEDEDPLHMGIIGECPNCGISLKRTDLYHIPVTKSFNY